MKNGFLLLFILAMLSCSSDSSNEESVDPTDDSAAEEEQGQQQEQGQGQEQQDEESSGGEILFDLSVFTLTNGTTKEYEIIKGDLSGTSSPINLTSTLSLPSFYRYRVWKNSFMAWDFPNAGPVWIYNAQTNNNNLVESYFDLGSDFFRDSPCAVPTLNNIVTFFHTADDPTLGDFYQVEIFDLNSEEIYQIDIPQEVVPEVNCLENTKFSSGDLVLFNAGTNGLNFSTLWGVFDANEKLFLTQFELPNLYKFSMSEEKIVLVNTALGSASFRTYDLNMENYSDDISVFYSSDYLNGLTGSTSISISSQYGFDAEFESNKMLFFNGNKTVITSGNISDFSGPSILNLETGELQIFSSLKIYEAYSNISVGRFNLEILQSSIDLESEIFVVTYKDPGYTDSPYGIMYFDFELNLIKHVELGNDVPIAMAKYK